MPNLADYAIPHKAEISLCRLMDGNMKVGILEIQICQPIAPPEGSPDGLRGLHLERLFVDRDVQGLRSIIVCQSSVDLGTTNILE